MLRYMTRSLKPVCVAMALLSLLMSMPLDYAAAALVETSICSQSDVDTIRSRLMLMLAREDVRTALMRHGLDPAEAQARVAALTGSELREIQGVLPALPAGAGGEIVAIPLALVILILIGYVLVISGIITLGVYAGVKVSEAQEKEDWSTKPYPAPPRTAPAPAFNPEEPWTGTWKVTDGQSTRFYVLRQNGDRVVSTPESDYRVEAKSYGALIRGSWFDQTTRPFSGTLKAIIADDYRSFKGDVNSRTAFTAERVDSRSAAQEEKSSGPWAGRWNVQGAPFASGLWVLKQEGLAVVSVDDSYHRVRGKTIGDRLEGEVLRIGPSRSDYAFSITLSADGRSFQGRLREERTGEWSITGTKIE